MITPTPIALVTGGSRGLGKSMALKLAEQGSDVILTYRSNRVAAEDVVAEIESMRRKAVALRLDVAVVSSFGTFSNGVGRVLQAHWQRDRFDHLVNNAGVGIHASFTETTEALFDELMTVQLKGPFFLTQALLPWIADGGRIVNISTGLTRFSLPGFAAYAAMKGGVVRDNAAMNAMIASQTALGRVGLPHDIGGVVASLLSPGSRWINGQRIEASGGMFL